MDGTDRKSRTIHVWDFPRWNKHSWMMSNASTFPYVARPNVNEYLSPLHFNNKSKNLSPPCDFNLILTFYFNLERNNWIKISHELKGLRSQMQLALFLDRPLWLVSTIAHSIHASISSVVHSGSAAVWKKLMCRLIICTPESRLDFDLSMLILLQVPKAVCLVL